MNEKELEALIAEVEEKGMIASPVYLKDLIMEQVHRNETARHRRKAAKIEFLTYSLKIAGAAAAAIFCLTQVPMNAGEEIPVRISENSHLEKKIERAVEQYRLENQRVCEEALSKGQQSDDADKGRIFPYKADILWKEIIGWLGMEKREND